MNPISVGVVGLGAIARKVHIPILTSFQDVKLRSVAEVDVKRGRRIAKKWNIPEFYKDYNEMLEGSPLDAVFVCLPNFLHNYWLG